MARTRLFEVLQRAARLHRSAKLAGIPVQEHAEESKERYLRARFDRRTFVKGSAAMAALGALPSIGLSACGGAAGTRVGIVGAGLAGLHCGYRLMNAGIDVKIFDAWDRTGGRTFTARGMLDGGQIAELGGELIDTNHASIQALAQELELQLDALDEPASIRNETFYFGGRVVPEMEVIQAFETIAPALDAALVAADESEDEYARLDAISIAEFLAMQTGASDLIKSILETAYVGEYGLEADRQSILNVVYLIDAATTDPFRIFGDSDEHFHIHNGSESIAEELTMRLGARIDLGTRLMAIRRSADGRVVLSVDVRGGGTREETFDRVVLALPFSTLRMVQMQDSLFPADKLQTIQELGYGTNAKLMMQFTSKPWRSMSMASGSGFADNGVQTTWETSRGQSGDLGILTHFVGGEAGVALGMGTPDARATAVLPLIDVVFPGTRAAFNARALRMHWPSAPFHLGSYACYEPGQWAFFGIEGRAEGNIHFAGEHTSEDFQGYMEGAVESGARAAMEVMASLGMMMRP